MKKIILFLLITVSIFAQTPPSDTTANVGLWTYPAGARGIADGLNRNWQQIDTYWKINADSITSLRTSLASYMPKSGGTFTGSVNMGTSYFYLPTMTPLLQGGLARTGTGLVTFGYGFGTTDTLVSRRYLRTANQTINGNTTFNGLVTLSNSFYTASDFDVDGNATFGGNVTFSGTVTGLSANSYYKTIYNDYKIGNSTGGGAANFTEYSDTTRDGQHVFLRIAYYKQATDDSLTFACQSYWAASGTEFHDFPPAIQLYANGVQLSGTIEFSTVNEGYTNRTITSSISGVSNGLVTIEVRGEMSTTGSTAEIKMRQPILQVKGTN